MSTRTMSVIGMIVMWTVLCSSSARVSADDGVWSPIGPPEDRIGSAGVYDPVGQRLVIFGGTVPGAQRYYSDTFFLTLSGVPRWERWPIDDGVAPPPRFSSSAVYDPIGQRMILYGGESPNGGKLGDVWALSLSGSLQWSELHPTGTPPATRSGHAAIYDPVRQRMVVFGGRTATNVSNEVWALSLDGSLAWSHILPSGMPPFARTWAAAAYDPVRDRMLFYGGLSILGSVYGDLGGITLGASPAWQRLSLSGPSRCAASAVYDPVADRLITYGGFAPDTARRECYQYSFAGAGSWSSLADAPFALAQCVGAYDSGNHQMVVYGGCRGDLDGAWTTDGRTQTLALGASPQWADRSPEPFPYLLPPRAMAYDSPRNRLIVLAQDTDFTLHLRELTIGFNPTWHSLTASGIPPSPSAAVYDPVRERMLVCTPPNVYALSLTGAMEWTALSTGSGATPHERSDHTMIYDPIADQIVIFGGKYIDFNTNDPVCLTDTWGYSLSGAPGWTQIAPFGPPGRFGHSAVYDQIHDRMLVFGGRHDDDALNDVWELDLRDGAWDHTGLFGTPPGPSVFAAAAFDASRGRLLIFGGMKPNEQGYNDLFALPMSDDIPTWSKLSPLGPQPYSGLYDAIYASGDRMVMVGFQSAWELRFTALVSAPDPPRVEPQFALAGLRPNPAARELNVAFTLPDAAPARLELFDLAGRRLEARDVGALGAGRHAVRIDRSKAMGQGVYLIRLVRDGRAIVTRGVVTR